MKKVEYLDERGYRQQALVRDNDTDPRLGIPLDLPDLETLDWEAIKRDLHGKLLDRGLLTLDDVQRNQPDFIAALVSALKRPLLRLYQTGE